MVKHDLIFDVGMHKGEDSEFYLKKGFRVVAVEAMQSFCAEVSARFSESVSSGRLVIVNKAISDVDGPVRFYMNEALSVWGTLNPRWAERNARRGAPSREITVESTRLEHLFQKFGVPYYLKIDIEGADLLCVEALRKVADRPDYLSIESNKVSWKALEDEFELLTELGYRRFKVVNQRFVSTQVPPVPAREGKPIEYQFRTGATGLFGEEAPGRWLSRDDAMAAYRRIFRGYRLFGDDGILRRSPATRRLLHIWGVQVDWYDTHAAR